MNIIFWLLFFHILGAITWLGGGVMLTIIGIHTRKNGDLSALAGFAQILSYVGLRLLTPAVVVVIGSGVWLVLSGDLWSFSQLWILQLALAAFFLAFLFGAIYLSRIALTLERQTKNASVTILTTRQTLTRWINGYVVVLILLLFILWDMLAKPGL